jgi:hypothetical protein
LGGISELSKGDLLIITDLGHASPRIPGIFSEVARLGWNVDLICPRISSRQKKLFLSGIDFPINFKIHYTGLYFSDYKLVTGNNLIKRLLRLFFRQFMRFRRIQISSKRTVFHSRDRRTGVENHRYWVPRVCEKAQKIYTRKPQSRVSPTIVLSSSSPFSAHIAASIVSTKFELPWIADYRDLWALNHSNLGMPDEKVIEFEKDVIASASVLTTVSNQLRIQQSSLFAGPINVIHNGFVVRPDRKQTEFKHPLVIVYTGSLYEKFMNLNLFLSTLDRFQGNSENPDFKVIFAGSISDEITKYYLNKHLKVPKYIEILGELPRGEIYQLQRAADIGLVLGWEDATFQGSFPTKFFEYLGANLHVLFSGGHPGDECANQIIQSDLGSVAHNSDALFEFFSSVTNNPADLKRNSSSSSQFSYSELAAKFDKLLSELK